MISKDEAKKLINDLFEEEALVLGGLVALHDIEDELIWRLARNLDLIRRKTLSRLNRSGDVDSSEPAAERPNLKPHPAIEHLLLNIRRSE